MNCSVLTRFFFILYIWSSALALFSQKSIADYYHPNLNYFPIAVETTAVDKLDPINQKYLELIFRESLSNRVVTADFKNYYCTTPDCSATDNNEITLQSNCPSDVTFTNWHVGLDHRAPYGTTVYSPIKGEILNISTCGIGIYNKEYDFTFFFTHINLTNENDTVEIGEVIGTTARSGASCTTNPHCHTEIMIGRHTGASFRPCDYPVKKDILYDPRLVVPLFHELEINEAQDGFTIHAGNALETEVQELQFYIRKEEYFDINILKINDFSINNVSSTNLFFTFANSSTDPDQIIISTRVPGYSSFGVEDNGGNYSLELEVDFDGSDFTSTDRKRYSGNVRFQDPQELLDEFNGENNGLFPYVELGIRNGIFGGREVNSDLLFEPNSSITRAEVAYMIAGATLQLGLLDPIISDTGYYDVPEATYFSKAVRILANSCITQTTFNGNILKFDPEKDISLGEAVTLLARAFGITTIEQNINITHPRTHEFITDNSIAAEVFEKNARLLLNTYYISEESNGFCEPIFNFTNEENIEGLAENEIIIVNLDRKAKRGEIAKMITNLYRYRQNNPLPSPVNVCNNFENNTDSPETAKANPVALSFLSKNLNDQQFQTIGTKYESAYIPSGQAPSSTNTTSSIALFDNQEYRFYYPSNTDQNNQGVALGFYWSVDNGEITSQNDYHSEVVFTPPKVTESTDIHLYSYVVNTLGKAKETFVTITVNPAEDDDPTLAPPTEQAHDLEVSFVTQDSAYFDWERGNGDGNVLFINELGTVSAKPIDGKKYIAGDNERDAICYLVGTSSFKQAFGFKANTTYEALVYEYSQEGDDIIYNKEQTSYQTFTTKDYPEVELDITWDVETPQTNQDIAFKKVSNGTTFIDIWKLTGPEERTFGLDSNSAASTFNVTVGTAGTYEISLFSKNHKTNQEATATKSIIIKDASEVGPDASVLAVSTDRQTYTYDGDLNVTVDLKNVGTENVIVENAEVYLSSDKVVDASDLIVTTYNLTTEERTILKEEQKSLSIKTKMPSSAQTSAGSFYILVKLIPVVRTSIDTVADIDASNDIGFTPVTIADAGNDWVCSILSVSHSSISSNQTFTVVAEKDNLISRSTLYDGINFYLSEDTLRNGNDVFLGSSKSGYAKNFSTDLIAPWDIATGNYYVIAALRFDNYLNQEDFNLDNNTSNAFPIYYSQTQQPTIGADNLSASDIGVSSAKISFDRGNGDGVLITMINASRAIGGSISVSPIYGFDYSEEASLDYSLGDIKFESSGRFKPIYDGTNSSIIVTGLEEGASYFASVFEYNIDGNEKIYKYRNTEKILFTTEDNTEQNGFERVLNANDNGYLSAISLINKDSVTLVYSSSILVKLKESPFFRIKNITGGTDAHVTSDGTIFSINTSSNDLRQTSSSTIFKEGKEVYRNESYNIVRLLKIDENTILGLGSFRYYARSPLRIIKEGGCIIKSTDNGNTWEQTQTFDYRLRDIEYADRTVFLSGSEKIVLSSNDMGSSFSRIHREENAQNTFVELLFFDKKNGLAIAARELYNTSNGGISWSLMSSFTGNGYNNLHKIDSKSAALFVGASSDLAITHDKGENWSIQSNNPYGSFIHSFGSFGSDIYLSDRNKGDIWYHPNFGISNTLKIESIQNRQLCSGDSTTIVLSYDSIASNSTVTAELSLDRLFEPSKTLVVGTRTSPSDSMRISIPTGMKSDQYYLRVVSTEPYLVSKYDSLQVTQFNEDPLFVTDELDVHEDSAFSIQDYLQFDNTSVFLNNEVVDQLNLKEIESDSILLIASSDSRCANNDTLQVAIKRNSQIAISLISTDTICSKDSVQISISIDNRNINESYSLTLSDSLGDFDLESTLMRFQTNYLDTALSVFLPPISSSSSNYRIKLTDENGTVSDTTEFFRLVNQSVPAYIEQIDDNTLSVNIEGSGYVWVYNDRLLSFGDKIQSASSSGIYQVIVFREGCRIESSLFDFKKRTYQINASSNLDSAGSVLGSGLYEVDDLAILTASPNDGYEFANWTVNDNVITEDTLVEITVTSDSSFVANFMEVVEPLTYSISVSLNIENAGIVTGAGVYNNGDTATLISQYNEGFTFENWSIGGNIIGTDSLLKVIVTSDSSFLANFEEVIKPLTYSIAASLNIEHAGVITGTGTYQNGDTATLVAEYNEGFTFENWKLGERIISTDSLLNIIVTSDSSFVANFTEAIELPTYSISVTKNIEEAGTITGSGIYEHGDTATLVAQRNEGFTFENWSLDENIIGTDSLLKVVATADSSFVANFMEVIEPLTYSIAASLNIEHAGVITGIGTYQNGDTATLVAQHNEGFTFENWSIGENNVSINSLLKFVVTADSSFVANFKEVVEPLTYSISASLNIENAGIVTGAGVYNNGDTAILIAKSNDGFTLENWSYDGTTITTDSLLKVAVTSDSSFVANFLEIEEPVMYSITITKNIEEAGSISGNGAYYAGDTARLQAISNYGYEFDHWGQNDAEYNDSLINVIVYSDSSFQAEFLKQKFSIDGDANTSGSGTITGTGLYQYKEVAQLTASPADGFRFKNWTEDETLLSADSVLTVTVLGHTSYTANFERKTHSVVLLAVPANGGDVFGARLYNEGDSAKIFANPRDGFEFQKWELNGFSISTDQQITVPVNASLIYRAYFSAIEIVLNVDPDEADKISVYPNPASTEITIISRPDTELTIYDQQVRAVKVIQIGETGKLDLDISELSSGVYSLVFKTQNDQEIKKLFKKL